jgi:hypothetical protein
VVREALLPRDPNQADRALRVSGGLLAIDPHVIGNTPCQLVEEFPSGMWLAIATAIVEGVAHGLLPCRPVGFRRLPAEQGLLAHVRTLDH